MSAQAESLTTAIAAEKKWRSVLFKLGAIAAVLSGAAAVCSWVDPFPLLSDGQGGYRVNPLDDWVLIAGLLTGLGTMTLAAFGKRAGRLLLIALGIVLMLFNVVSWLGNHR